MTRAINVERGLEEQRLTEAMEGMTSGKYKSSMEAARLLIEEYLDTFVIVYLDDVLNYRKDAEDHERQIKQVLRKLDETDMILNLKKCQFFAWEVKFLGRILSAEGLRPDPWNISKIIDWPRPRNITNV
jgi:Reverse transcriptase (RNA-dependent DNA polymerase)